MMRSYRDSACRFCFEHDCFGCAVMLAELEDDEFDEETEEDEDDDE